MARTQQLNRWLPTNSVQWRSIRAQVLKEEPHCRLCLTQGKRVLGNEVDHIDGQAATLHDNRRSNLQTLCKPCHSSKTMRESNRQAGRRTSVGCDVNGHPIGGGDVSR